MADEPKPTPDSTPTPNPEPPAPAPTEPPTPAPQEPTPDPTPGPKGEPDGFKKLERMVVELKEQFEKGNPTPAQTEPTEPNLDEVKAQHAAQAKNWAIERELLKAGCIDTDALMVHVKADEVKLSEDGKTISEGLDVDELKKSYSYLFPTQTDPKPTVSTSANPGGAQAPTEAMTIKQGLEMSTKK
nr:MAG TPA: minor structural protein [Caudoviricetes sp.]